MAILNRRRLMILAALTAIVIVLYMVGVAILSTTQTHIDIINY